MLGLVGAGTAVILTLLLAPWNWMPTEYAEEITVIAVTDYGCVGESQVGNSVVVSDCSASVGDVISAEFYAPASDKNGYYDRIYEKASSSGTIDPLSLFVFKITFFNQYPRNLSWAYLEKNQKR